MSSKENPDVYLFLLNLLIIEINLNQFDLTNFNFVLNSPYLNTFNQG